MWAISVVYLLHATTENFVFFFIAGDVSRRLLCMGNIREGFERKKKFAFLLRNLTIIPSMISHKVLRAFEGLFTSHVD